MALVGKSEGAVWWKNRVKKSRDTGPLNKIKNYKIEIVKTDSCASNDFFLFSLKGSCLITAQFMQYLWIIKQQNELPKSEISLPEISLLLKKL